MSGIVRDVRYAARRLRNTPGFSAVAITALALGIGLTTIMFSIVYGVLVRGLPFPNGDRIGIVYRNNPELGIRRQSLPIQDFFDYRAQQHSFTVLGGYTSGTVNVSGAERADRIDASWITADVFSILGVQPIRGRGFIAREASPHGDRVAVLSYRIWRDRFAGRQDAIGAQIRIDGSMYTVVGVMPQGFGFPASEAIWLPLQVDPGVNARGHGEYLIAIGALKPGVTWATAAVEASTIARQLALAHPESNKGFDATVGTFTDWSIGPQPRRLLITMLGAVFCVLLVACANVMNLLSDRATHRTREVGIRVALGASRWSVLREFLIETALLSAVGVALAVGLAYLGVAAFNRATLNSGFPSFVQVGLFVPVLAFAAAMGVISALAAGLIPALQSSRGDVAEVLKDESRGASSFRIGRMSKALVMFEIALSCVLLVAAGLMIESVAKIRTIDPGFATRDVFTAGVAVPASSTDIERQLSTFGQFEERVRALPGVRAVSISSGLPGAQQGLSGSRISLEGTTYARETDRPIANTLAVSPGFFATLGIALSEGRLFTIADRAGAEPVAVVTKRFVRQILAGTDPIGRRIRLGSPGSEAWVTIVGVVPDIFGGDPEDPRPAIVFRPLNQAPASEVYVSARVTGDVLGLTSPVRDALFAVNPDLPLYWPMSLAEAIAQPLWFVRVFGTMFMGFGFVALFLGMVGLYAVMSFSVSRRARELGIRIALGAQRGTIVRLILGQGAVQLGVGLCVGLTIAVAIAPLLSAVLVGVQPRDPIVFGAVVAALFAAGTLACIRPASRATRVDPMQALREE